MFKVFNRQKAIDNGELLDITQTAMSKGFLVPTAMTPLAFEGNGGDLEELLEQIRDATAVKSGNDFCTFVQHDNKTIAGVLTMNENGSPTITICLKEELYANS